MRASEPVSFWRENEIAVVSLSENGAVAKTSPRNLGDAISLESRKDLAISFQNICHGSLLKNCKMELPRIQLLFLNPH